MTSGADEEDYRLELTLEAQDDLRDIIQYTLETWDETQALVYRDKLVTALEILCDNPCLGHSRSDILPGYRAYPVGEHVLIYWLTKHRECHTHSSRPYGAGSVSGISRDESFTECVRAISRSLKAYSAL